MCSSDLKEGGLKVLAQEAKEVHNVEERLGPLFLERPSEAREPSRLIRAGGYLLLWTMAAVICYSAAIVAG